MVSKASREEKTKAKNSSDVDRLADLLGAIKINEGACWAVASVAAVESATRISSGPEVSLPPLSVQQILDCARGDGCRGGLETDAYCYIIKNRGLASEERYGSTEKNGICDKSRASQVVGGSIMAFALVRPQTETALEEALCRGPVTAGIAANSLDFVKYSGGIFRGACGVESDHAVLVVGYGKDDDGTKYWKIQNSWGKSWGEGGYMRMSYEAGEGCEITQNASFPLVNVTDYEIR
ncbi:PREDICTED: fruit bromelain-like [Fragaria vesca subsp. vesca]